MGWDSRERQRGEEKGRQAVREKGSRKKGLEKRGTEEIALGFSKEERKSKMKEERGERVERQTESKKKEEKW